LKASRWGSSLPAGIRNCLPQSPPRSAIFFLPRSSAGSAEETLEKLNQLPSKERQTLLERGARKERRVIFYTTFNVADLQDIKKVFEQKYPLLKVEPFRLWHGRLANKITTEALAGKLEADAISIPGNYVADFRKLGVIARNRTPLGTQLSDGFVDKEGWIHGMYSTAYVLQYNTKLVKPEELPRDWPDLLDPRWKGQIALDQEGYNGSPASWNSWVKRRELASRGSW
jgi:hypothetical protein